MAIDSKNLLVAVKAFAPANPLPLDSRSLQGSQGEAETYAKQPNAYAGQIITAKVNGKYKAFVLQGENGNCTLEAVGADPSALKQYVIVGTRPESGQQQGVIYIDTNVGYIWDGAKWVKVFEDVSTSITDFQKRITKLESDINLKANIANANFTGTVKRNLWGVYFDANGGTGAPSMMKRHWGEIVYIPYTKPTRPGYTFKGWTKSKGSSTLHYSPGDPIGDDFDVTLYAIWGQNVTRTWSITYNANGGYNAPAKQTANVGQSITITYSKPTRSGYTFLGWSTWSGATEPESAYTPGYSYMSEYDTTLYAVWKQNQVTQYSLSFNLQGGTGAFNTLYGGYGERVQIPYTTPTKSGYTFKGWSTSSTGSPQYQPGDYYTIYRNTILYAIWSESTQYCTITFNANGGSGAPSSQQKIIGEQTYIPYTKPTRSGYTFLGWSTSSWATSADYQPGSVYTPYGNMTFYAVWKQNVVRTWSIIYDANGGINAPERQTANVGQSIVITHDKPTRSGYIFLGWNSWSGATEPDTMYNPGYSYTSDSDTTLYAIWEEDKKMYLGYDRIRKIYIGNKQVTAAYLGTTKIW